VFPHFDDDFQPHQQGLFMRFIMNPLTTMLAALLLGAAPPTWAALPVGTDAPDFATEAALAGVATKFSLSQTLKKGPVVLYFYPKAFTSGCTVEAHNFAEATDKFNKLGATVVGVSNDTIDTLQKFSVEACRNKFVVAADGGAQIIKKYDVGLMLLPNTADRVSYVISPQGKVLYVYSSLSPDEHVGNTMRAVEQWRAAAKK
jgi:peroxiredoxin Q/BCP